MKLECSAEKLKNAIQQTERITGKNLTLPVLNSILMIASGKSLKLRSTNLSLGIEVEISAKIEEEGVTAIKGDVINNLFSNFNRDQVVRLELINDNLNIKTKNNNILIKSHPYEDFPTIPIIQGQNFTIPSNRFIDGIKSVYYSSSISDIKPEISSVYIYNNNDNLVFVSTDSFRLAEKKIKVKNMGNFPEVIIPLKNIIEIIRILGDKNEELNISLNKNQISFSGNGLYLTSRIIDGNFPDYKQIMPKDYKTNIITLKQDLLTSLKITNIFSDKFNQINLKIKPKDKLLELSSKNSDVGENKTTVDGAVSGEEVELSFNHKYILDCFQSITEDSINMQLNGANKPMIIRGVNDNSFTYLIMPMNR